MVKPNHFWIEVANKQPIYYSGQMIYGNVFLSVSKETNAAAISITLMGKGQSQWITYSGSNPVVHRKSQTLIEETIPLWKKNGEKLSIGNYSFPFQFQLGSEDSGHQLPCSFEYTKSSTYGRIRYSLYARVERPWKFDYKTEFPLAIMNSTDCNSPMYVEPFTVSDKKKMIFRGAVNVDLHLERRAYCPGDIIRGVVKANNLSSSELLGYSIKLYRKVVLGSRSDKECISTTLCTSKSNEHIPPRTETEFPISLTVPTDFYISPSIPKEQCHAVRVEYFVKLKLKTPKMSTNFTITSPITIGTIRFAALPSFQVHSDDLARLSNPSYVNPKITTFEPVDFPVSKAPEYIELNDKEDALSYNFSYQFIEPSSLINIHLKEQ